jgi:hypothetical protein
LAEEAFRDLIELGDGTIVEAKAWRVPESEEFPEGLKYSFQHYDPETGETLLRYDNYNKHAGSRHHKHEDGETEAVEFEGLKDHYERFLDEVEKNER